MEIDIEKLADNLEGSRCSLDEMIAEMTGDPNLSSKDLTKEQHMELDERVSTCVECGHWTPTDLMNENEDGDLICDDCYEEPEEDEDEE